MPLTINFAADKLPEKGTVIITAGDGGKLGALGKALDKTTGGAITKAIKIKKFKGKPASMFALLAPAKTSLDRIVVLGVGDAKKLSALDAEKMGGTALGAVEKADGAVTFLLEPMGNKAVSDADIAARAATGALLRNYKFETYKTKNKTTGGPSKFTVATKAVTAAKKAYAELKAVAEGTMLARDLVNEPSNILTPPEFAKRAKALTKLGVKVEVLSEAQMKKLGMGSLLGVGQGSVQPSQMVVMQWNGAAKSKKPVAFIGKGVCFDTGGISIKPAGGMEDMKGDMGGAAAVTGLMHALASRKAKVNAIGVLGLVENMPDGNAQRPGDIVTSMSGQTIEVLNTDAEGRLVLADALWYTQKRFKPQFMIDLATLTGAIMIALGQDYAGMFASDDKLAEQLDSVGKAEGELVWRMPMNDNFDKMINTPNADMKNIGGRYAGSSTAAQFLKRFTNDVPWVHLDIAGTAMGSPKSSTSRTWASGYGVRLLDRLVKAHYE
jgi:leucyl aminopeptidase